MNVKINWRIQRPNGQFYERSDIQTFYADKNSSSVLHNNGNEYLHYQDDWYIPGYKEGEYVFVYYRGTNDAWDGYGGATVYSTKSSLDPAYIPELTEIAKKVNVNFADFVVTDNSCKAAEPLKFARPSDLDTLGDDVRVVEQDLGKGVMSGSRFVGKEARMLGKEVGKDARAIEREVERDAQALKDEVQMLERKLVSVGGPRFSFFKTDGDEGGVLS
jgi:violaxanthin de-epoxidase